MSQDPVRQVDYGTYESPQGQPCGTCGHAIDAATELPGNQRGKPVAGDASLCLRCGALEVFTGTALWRRAPTAAEAEEFAANPRAVRAQRLIRAERPLG